MSILGNRVNRVEDRRLLTGRGGFVANIELPGCLELQFVGSTVAHGTLGDVDISSARSAPGVVAVYSGGDVDLPALPSLIPPDSVPGYPGANPAMTRPVLAVGKVRFVGEPIVAVVSEDSYRGSDACELVTVDIMSLPAVVDPDTAARDEILLFPDAGTNVACEVRLGDDSDVLSDADIVVTQRIVNQRVAAAPLEPRAAAASFADGRLTFFASTQAPGGLQMMLGFILGIGPENVRVVATDVGGGFGAKGLPTSEELLVGWLAMRLGRPIRWIESRSENLKGMFHGRGQVQNVEMGFRRDGTITGFRLDVIQDCGAYPGIAPMLQMFTWLMASGPYEIPRLAFHGRAVTTTTTPVGAFRGAGRPEATFALERAIDLGARRLGMDPVDVRRRNLVVADRFPYTTPTGAVYDSGDYAGALDRALAAADYKQLRAAQERRRGRGDTIESGIGVACYVEITNPLPQAEMGRVRVTADGRATVFTGSGPHGQGHQTSWAMIASACLGIPMEQVEVVYGDTDVTPPGGATGGSRSAQTAGVVVHRAAESVVSEARRLAADELEASAEDIVLDRDSGRLHVAGSPTPSLSWEQVAALAGGSIEAESTMDAGPSYPFGSHVAVVDVDTQTGGVTLRRLVACDDCGRILNPTVVEGQIHGGLAQGVAQALLEQVVFDADGNPLTSTFADFLIVSAAELPSFEVVEQETPTPNNELGAKGVGESGTIGATPAVVSAVLDALAPYGVTHIDLSLIHI